MRKNSAKQIDSAAEWGKKIVDEKLLFHFNEFNLPTTCKSLDTIMVLKCGASAETVCINI